MISRFLAAPVLDNQLHFILFYLLFQKKGMGPLRFELRTSAMSRRPMAKIPV